MREGTRKTSIKGRLKIFRLSITRSGWALARKSRPSILMTVLGAAGVTSCDGVTEPPPGVNNISLSVTSLTLAPGTSEQVAVTISPQTSVRLTLTGMPAGVRATFSPDFLPEGETRSTLTVAADSAAGPSEVTLTLRAVAGGPANSGASIQATTSLRLRVTECPGYAIPTNCPPFPTGGSSVIRGTVVERSRESIRPAAGASVWAWVQYPNGNGYSAGRIQTDSLGVYQFGGLPNALIVMQTAAPGFDQPCASIVQLAGPSATANLELVSQANPIAEADPPRPSLVGTVYEITASGRQPVPGARVYFETLFEIVAATTTTDQLGRYSFCRLPSFDSFVTPVRSGYVTSSRAVSVSGRVEMDLEMKRQ